MAVCRLLEIFRALFRSSSTGSSSTDESPNSLESSTVALALPGPAPRVDAGEINPAPPPTTERGPVPIVATERLSRFVFTRKYVNAERVHFRAFEPPANEQAISVSRTEGFSEDRVWEHGDVWAIGESTREIVGRGDFAAGQVSEVRVDAHTLAAVPDEPPPHHANVTGWPPPSDKEIRRLLAIELASKAAPVVRQR